MRNLGNALLALLAVVTTACTEDTSTTANGKAPPDAAVARPSEVPVDPERNAYFGNLHVHTGYSFDAYAQRTRTTPEDAYRWAKGEPITDGTGQPPMRIRTPLDWYAVSDHAEYLGAFPLMADPSHPFSKLELAKRVTSEDGVVALGAYAEVNTQVSNGVLRDDIGDTEVGRSVWADVVSTADAHDDPGTFTTFAAYEWTSAPDARNMHRVVLFRGTGTIPDLPFSAIDSSRPEDLWAWMDDVREGGTPLLAVPHNGNASDGIMFPVEESFGGSQLNLEYAQARMRNEPLYEITQIKGTSETHPSLAPNDEFAGFELWDYTIAPGGRRPAPESRPGSYVRDAFKRGLALEAAGKGNPFRYGVIGDSDTHNAAASIEEDNYTGKFGVERDRAHRLNGIPGYPETENQQVREFSSGGVAGVWAESNTRDALFAAMQRRETFATSGPRMRVRVFAGYGFDAGALEGGDWVKRAYAAGVPMGADLPAGDGAPSLVISAIKEADGANLDRVQVVKGWLEDGEPQERIYDVAWSGDRAADADGNLPPVGNTVDATDASYTNAIGATELATVWQDPDFDPSAHAFYYVRVLQIPTPRWSTYDAAALGLPPRDDVPVSIQERAWTSPIWYSPGP
ncbi:MAG TPA: DUF3604 domain-containing protein [Pseudomonadales bacterium]|nr:DUF3604 domain-containing protein [Pseudomonadales bacterium]